MPGRLLRIVVVTVMAFTLASCADSIGQTWTYTPVTSASAEIGATATPHSDATRRLQPTARSRSRHFDLGFEPASVTARLAGSYEVTFHNAGAVQRDITFADATKVPAEPGAATAGGNVTIPDWGLQAMDLSPAQGGFVEFVPAEDGIYAIATHTFNPVGRGPLGILHAKSQGPAS